ncbi:hypothetical protein ASPCADRAFT_211175 [Aspergillus carbonarius ITEM 5010]|uniref:Uncharacterized protein n=1 Tax=Aspergillus carbonarius (strain ITEM 5010) TaxID=602072 RepID=A0A1R3RA33_ASPC5|nr:hypothetical protein ASPCADRAFT_211175 [Aspergillus carbonarius ITEM 5010]
MIPVHATPHSLGLTRERRMLWGTEEIASNEGSLCTMHTAPGICLTRPLHFISADFTPPPPTCSTRDDGDTKRKQKSSAFNYLGS